MSSTITSEQASGEAAFEAATVTWGIVDALVNSERVVFQAGAFRDVHAAVRTALRASSTVRVPNYTDVPRGGDELLIAREANELQAEYGVNGVRFIEGAISLESKGLSVVVVNLRTEQPIDRLLQITVITDLSRQLRELTNKVGITNELGAPVALEIYIIDGPLH